MPKAIKEIQIHCDNHQFCLKPRNELRNQGQSFCLSFCTGLKKIKKSKRRSKEKEMCGDCPEFNNDGNYATPTFILSSEKDYYREKGSRLLEQHEKKMDEYTEEKSSMNVAKPRSKNNYCNVCRENYEDYLQHIESPRHKKCISVSKFNTYILQTSEKLNPKINKGRKDTVKTIEQKNLVEIVEDSEVEIISNPNKGEEGNNTRPTIRANNETMMRQGCFNPSYNGLASNSNFEWRQPMGMTFNCNMNIYMNPPAYMPACSYPMYNHPMMNLPMMNPLMNHPLMSNYHFYQPPPAFHQSLNSRTTPKLIVIDESL